ncbi:MAG: hypothetical protein IPK44_25475 [Candidatus Accumulibacter sp.]|uniref:hypothetical protein n=1 Tax=Accumulibacter sp. TaxID=2053492 RepID=UPI0025828048|nr:hypothetical protein [Accumulibacter sp.]MBK8117640.1 hypothetical protein [Accumulibacter sp.]
MQAAWYLVANPAKARFEYRCGGRISSLVILSNAKAPDELLLFARSMASHRTADEKMVSLAAATATLLPYALGSGDRRLPDCANEPGVICHGFQAICLLRWLADQRLSALLPVLLGTAGDCHLELMQEAIRGSSERLTGFSLDLLLARRNGRLDEQWPRSISRAGGLGKGR